MHTYLWNQPDGMGWGVKPRFTVLSVCVTTLQTHRLRAGAVPWRGRVEVKKEGVWGTVHGDTFGLAEANVACRAAGYGTALTTQSDSAYGRGIGPVHYQSVRYVAICISTLAMET